MGKLKDMLIQVQEHIEAGELTFQQIADKFGLKYEDVLTVYEQMMSYIQDNDYVDSYDFDYEE